MGWDWLKLGVILVAAAVWILSHLARKGEEPRRSKPPPLPPKDEDTPGRQRRRAPSEVDKFLAEVRRRRDTGEAAKPKKPDDMVESQPRAQPVETPYPRPASRSVPPPLPVPTPVPHRPPTVQPMPSPRPRRTAPAQEVIVAEVVPAVASTAVPVESSAPAPALAEVSQPVGNPVFQTVALLKNPQSLASAVLLREILEAPLCRRTGAIPAFPKQ